MHIIQQVSVLVLLCITTVFSAFPWTTIQQNDEFLALLQVKPPIGINIFFHYYSPSKTVSDARGNTYTVTLTGSTTPVVTIPTNAVTDVISLNGPINTVWTWPTLPTTYTRCWAVRNTAVDNWTVACFANTSPFTYIVDQTTMSVPTIAPLPVSTSSGNFLHSTYTWAIALTSTEMKVVTMALRKELGGIPYGASTDVIKISDLRAYYMRFLIALKPPQSINIFADVDGTGVGSTIPDRVAGLFNVTVTGGTVAKVSYTGMSNGANNPITVLRGIKTSQLVWPIDNIPAIKTICSISRYSVDCAVDTAGCGFIFTSVASPTVSESTTHGHGVQKRGVARYSKQWITQTTSSVGPRQTDWLVMCGTSGGTAVPNNVIIDQFGVGVFVSTNNQVAQWNINYEGSSSTTSNFEVHSLYIWPAFLSAVQMRHVTSALRAQIGGQPDITGNAVGPFVVPMIAAPTAYEQ
ncbi:hypothetical protein T484DRAFT_1757959, partial [Baffinella frigidus]